MKKKRANSSALKSEASRLCDVGHGSPPRSKKKKQLRLSSNWVISLWAVAFVCFGIWLLIGVGSSTWYWWRTRALVQVDGQLLTVERAGKNGGSIRGTFTYEHEGRQFTSHKVTLFSGSKRLYAPLHEALQKEQKIRVYIDPSNPSLAVIDREFLFWSWIGLIVFGLVFITAGFFVLRTQWREKRYAP